MSTTFPVLEEDARAAGGAAVWTAAGVYARTAPGAVARGPCAAGPVRTDDATCGAAGGPLHPGVSTTVGVRAAGASSVSRDGEPSARGACGVGDARAQLGEGDLRAGEAALRGTGDAA